MAPPTPSQLVWRARMERVLVVAGPVLDLVLAGGERISRLVADAPPRSEPLRPVTIPPQRAVGPGRPSGD